MGIPWGPSVAFQRRNQYMLLQFFREAQPPSHTPWAHRSTSPTHISASACPITSVLSPKRTPLLSAIYWRHLLVCARAPPFRNGCILKTKSICWVQRGLAPTIITRLLLVRFPPFFHQKLHHYYQIDVICRFVCARPPFRNGCILKTKIDLFGAERASPNHHNLASAGPITSVLSPKITPLLSSI